MASARVSYAARASRARPRALSYASAIRVCRRSWSLATPASATALRRRSPEAWSRSLVALSRFSPASRPFSLAASALSRLAATRSPSAVAASAMDRPSARTRTRSGDAGGPALHGSTGGT